MWSQPQKHGTYDSTSGCSAANRKTCATTCGGRGSGSRGPNGIGGRLACLCGPNFAVNDGCCAPVADAVALHTPSVTTLSSTPKMAIVFLRCLALIRK